MNIVRNFFSKSDDDMPLIGLNKNENDNDYNDDKYGRNDDENGYDDMV